MFAVHCIIREILLILYRDKLEDDKEFDVVGDLSELQAKPLEEQPANQNGDSSNQEEGMKSNQNETYTVHLVLFTLKNVLLALVILFCNVFFICLWQAYSNIFD